MSASGRYPGSASESARVLCRHPYGPAIARLQRIPPNGYVSHESGVPGLAGEPVAGLTLHDHVLPKAIGCGASGPCRRSIPTRGETVKSPGTVDMSTIR